LKTSDAQVRKLMEEMSKHGQVGVAAMKAGMDRKTGHKYIEAGLLPSQMKEERQWRTRPDPFEQDWPQVQEQLELTPTLEARTLLQWLMEMRPGCYEEGHLRTLQRRVKQWRAQKGPDKRVYFAQQHRPGEAAQTDFTWCNELNITLAGVLFLHMLCHVVLPFSNWHWVTVCLSESMAALKRGIQAAVFRLGRVTQYHQTDNSTAATHDLRTGKRGFNEDYLALMRHLGMEPRTIEVGKKEQNGDVESSNGALKRKLEQHLLLRGNRDFGNRDEYEKWAQQVVDKDNHSRHKQVALELEAMRPLRVERLCEYVERSVRVSAWSTIRVMHNAYSVPSRLIGEEVVVRIWEEQLQVLHGAKEQLRVERQLGRNGHRINYRHIIGSLVRHPGAFARYKYRDELFPSLTFRKAYDALCSASRRGSGDLEYLRILHLAATTLETEVETALELLLQAGNRPTPEAVKALVSPSQIQVPALVAAVPDLHSYDALLSGTVNS
jgi:hypothetical protein